MVTPGQIIEPPPSQTLSPIVIGEASSLVVSLVSRSIWMMSSINLNLGRNQDIVADVDSITIKNCAVIIDIQIVTGGDIAAIVTVKGRSNCEIFTNPIE